MLIIGMVLVVVSVLALVAALTGGSNDPATFDLGLFEVQTNTLGVFLLGAGTVLLFVMGLELVRSGVRRGHRRRQETKELNRLNERLAAAEAERKKDAGEPEREETAESPPRRDDQGNP